MNLVPDIPKLFPRRTSGPGNHAQWTTSTADIIIFPMWNQKPEGSLIYELRSFLDLTTEIATVLLEQKGLKT